MTLENKPFDPMQIEIDDITLGRFAEYLLPAIREFYDCQEGKDYYEDFIKKNPKYRPKEEFDDDDDW